MYIYDLHHTTIFNKRLIIFLKYLKLVINAINITFIVRYSYKKVHKNVVTRFDGYRDIFSRK